MLPVLFNWRFRYVWQSTWFTLPQPTDIYIQGRLVYESINKNKENATSHISWYLFTSVHCCGLIMVKIIFNVKVLTLPQWWSFRVLSRKKKLFSLIYVLLLTMHQKGVDSWIEHYFLMKRGDKTSIFWHIKLIEYYLMFDPRKIIIN